LKIAHELRRFPRAYWCLWLGLLINRAGGFVLPFLMLFLTQERSVPVSVAGSVLSAYGAGSVVASIAGGQLSDRWGRRPTLLTGLGGGALALLALANAVALPAIFVGTFAFGFFSELFRPPLSAAVSDLTTPEDRTAAFGYIFWAYNLGFAIAAAAAGFLAQHFGYTALFVGDAMTMLACGALVFAFVPETRPLASRALTTTTASSAPSLSVLRDPALLLLLAAALPTALLLIQFASVLPVLFREDGIDGASYGRIVALNGVIIVLLQPWATSRLRAFSRPWVLGVGSLLVGCGFGSHALADSASAHAIAVCMWTLGEIAVVPLLAVVVAELAPEAQRGRYQGAYALTWSTALLVSPFAGAQALTTLGALGWGFACAGAGGCAAVLHAIFAMRLRDRDASAAQLRGVSSAHRSS
jgi:MFS family permease